MFGKIITGTSVGIVVFVGLLLNFHWISPLTAFVLVTIPLTAIGLLVRHLSRTGIIRNLSREAPLSGVKVIDLANVVAGPWAATNLAHLGAEVITVENLGLIDSCRGLGSAPAPGMASLFAVTGRGKQSIIIDCKTVEGKEVFGKFVSEADVVLQNFRPGVADRLGIGYKACKNWNQDIIYLSSSGFGNSGPKSKERIYDPVIQCASGAGEIQKYPTSGAPCLVNNIIIDKISALTNFQALTAALVARKNGRGGQHIESAMLDSAMQYLWCDGYLDYTWEDSEIKDEERFLDKVPKGVPGFENDIHQAKNVASIMADKEFMDKHITHVDTAMLGSFKEVKFPVKFKTFEMPKLFGPPMLGEHTVKILKELDYTDKEIAKFLKSKAVISTASLCEMKGDDKKKKIFNIIEDLQTGSTNTFATTKAIHDTHEDFSHIGGGPLAGYTVVEFAHLACGPMIGMVMADQGARVIKLETEDCLDPSRKIGTNGDKQMGAMFATLNRNKECQLLNHNLGDLLANADVFIIDKHFEHKLQINYETAKKMKPDIIYCRIDKGRGEYHCQCVSGIASCQRDSTGKNIWVEGMQCEKMCGMIAAGAVTAALYGNQGQGDCLDVDMEKSAMYCAMLDTWWNDVWDKPLPAMANFPPIDKAFKFCHTKDNIFLYSLALGDKEFEGFIKEFGTGEGPIKEKIEAGQMKTIGQRICELEKYLDWWGGIIAKLTFEEYEPKRQAAGVSSSVVMSRKEALQDEQLLHSKIVQKVTHPTLGTYSVAKPAVNFCGTPCRTEIKSAGLPGEKL